MSGPMPHRDPVRIGPFRLVGRLSETPAGITYLGTDSGGRRVSIAVLTRGAAGDAAARDRFRAAVVAVWGGDPAGGRPPDEPPPDEPPPAAAARARPGGDAPEVIAAQPDGPAPWVATAYEQDLPGAEHFLDTVLLKGAFGARRSGDRPGPSFQPYWIGSREPAVEVQDVPAPVPGTAGPAPRGAVATAVIAAGMLGLILLLASLLYACRPIEVPEPSDLPSPPSEPSSIPPPTPRPTTTVTETPAGGDG